MKKKREYARIVRINLMYLLLKYLIILAFYLIKSNNVIFAMILSFMIQFQINIEFLTFSLSFNAQVRNRYISNEKKLFHTLLTR